MSRRMIQRILEQCHYMTVLLIILQGCANPLPPSGGPRDMEPPSIVHTIPSDKTMLFNENSILIEEFAPFGPKKEREPLIDAKLDHALHDKAFNELSKIVDKVLSYNSGCDEEECNDAFFSEPVFPMHNRNKLRKLGVEPNIINEEPLITIGDVHNSANPSKGGKHKRTQKKKRIQKKKSYKKKKQTYKKKSYKKK